MSLAQIAKVAAKVAQKAVKSPMGKIGMAAVAGGAVASIFSGCKKAFIYEEHDIDMDNPVVFPDNPPIIPSPIDQMPYEYKMQLNEIFEAASKLEPDKEREFTEWFLRNIPDNLETDEAAQSFIEACRAKLAELSGGGK
jgi:hypothetical protein